MICCDCRFWYKDGSQCRRYAPHPSEAPMAVGAAVSPRDAQWPHVDAEDWCGEFQPAVVSPADRIMRR